MKKDDDDKVVPLDPKRRPAKNQPTWIRDTRGRIITSDLENLRLALRTIGVHLSYDAFARELRVNGALVPDDIAFQRIWTQITDTCGWQPNRLNLQTIMLVDAQDKASTHPVREYLARLTWDRTPRLTEWLITYAGAIDTPYVRSVSPLPLLAAVRRVRAPGAKFDELLVLESRQGTLKSTALRTLCGVDDWFSDDLPLDADSKHVIERTAGKWIIEAAELHGNRGKETTTLKAFLSRQVDGPVRMAYGRLSISVPRQFVLIGTTNHRTGYLKDMTGARRFWPVTITGFDVEALARDRDQIWAEAVQREPDTSIQLSRDLWEAAAVEQEARRAPDPWEEIIERRITNDLVRITSISASEIWTLLGVEANQCDNRHADRVTGIMERFGFQKRRAHVGVIWEDTTLGKREPGEEG